MREQIAAFDQAKESAMMPHQSGSPAATAVTLVAAYVARDRAEVRRVVESLSAAELAMLLEALADLARSTRASVTKGGGLPAGFPDEETLDRRIHQVMGQLTDLESEAAMQWYLHRKAATDWPETMAETIALIHGAAACVAVLMESQGHPSAKLVRALRAFAGNPPQAGQA